VAKEPVTHARCPANILALFDPQLSVLVSSAHAPGISSFVAASCIEV